MSIKFSSKEILAKLMATENIFVEHANVPTAGFDLINRKLLLPNWKNISDDVYTLLISHEVGHALYTPTKEWEDAIIKEKNASYKQVVNIVEDVRIEKLIQNKFPGTTRAFKSGYDELEKSNLFGTKGREISSYGLLDRLNLHFKLGHFGYVKIPFSDVEKPWIQKISSCKSFSDVLKVATELKQFVEENPESQGAGGQSSSCETMTEVEFGENQNSSNKTEQKYAKIVSEKKNSKNLDNSSSQNSDTQNFNTDESASKNNSQSDSFADPSNEQQTNSKVVCETQKHFDSALKNLIDDSIVNTKYANFPELELNRLIVDYKTVHKQITEYYSTHFTSVYSDAEKQVEMFKNSSKNMVNQLANIFEMKKKAKMDVKSLTSTTGKLDTNRVHSYRYNEDIFKKVTTTPQGKSHGLIMFIDMSSSMCENIAGTFDQLLNLVLFCKRVNIPFDVYGFTDAYSARSNLQKHQSKTGCLTFEDSFCLRHYFSNRMSGHEFNKALQNIICIMKHYSGLLYAGLPPQENLNTTPLVPAIMVATQLVQKFRSSYGLDIVNTIFLTDGDDTHGLVYQTEDDKTTNRFIGNKYYFGSKSSTEKYYVRDVKSRKQWEVKNTTSDMLDILKEISGVKTIGFHIIKKREIHYVLNKYISNQTEQDKHIDSFKNHKFAELNNIPGYDAYYIIPSGSNLSVEEDEFESSIDPSIDWDDEKQAKKAMKAVQKSFSNFMKQKVTSRILLNRFIDQIS